MRHLRRPRNRQHHRRLGEQPRQRHLGRLSAEPGRRLVERSAGLREVAGGEREPRDEADVLASAVVEHRFRAAIGQVVAVLHRDDRHDAPGRLDVRDGDLRQADVANLPLALQIAEDAELVRCGNGRVDAVELEQVDPLDAEPAQAHLAFLPQILGPAQRRPLVRPRPCQPSLRGDDESGRVRMQRLADQILADVRAVRVRGVDQVDAELDRAPQDGERLLAVGRLAPDAGAGDLHRPEAEPMHGQIAADPEGAARRGGSLGCCRHG